MHNRSNQILKMSLEDRHKARYRVMYKVLRRQGYSIEQAVQEVQLRVVRLLAASTIMEASDWNADPVRLMQNT